MTQTQNIDKLLSYIPAPNETWKELNIDERYFVSNRGNVLSLCGVNVRILKPFLLNGYMCVCIRGRNWRVHRLVAQAFIGYLDDTLDVHHKDRDRENNDMRNLEILTQEEHKKKHKERLQLWKK